MTTANEPMKELIAFLDANIVLEGKPVADLPWKEIATEGLVRVFIVPKAMEEIDAKKRDGRLGPHARAFNRLIGQSVLDGKPVTLREANPRVELQIAICSRIPWKDYDELDPDDGDSRIVAEALNARNLASDNRLLVSHDIKPLAYARGRNMPVYQASDKWLREPEPSPKDKEIQRLKQQVAEFKKDEPNFDISVNLTDANPLVIYEVINLDPDQTAAIVANIKSNNPKKPNGGSDPFGLRSTLISDRDSSYDEKYDNYLSRRIPLYAEEYKEKLETIFNQRLFKVCVRNTGQVRADNLVISISISDGWINDKVVAVSPSGPTPPMPRSDHFRNLGIQNSLMRDLTSPRIGRHDYEVMLRAQRSQETEVCCEDFRSGQCYYFEGTITPSSVGLPLSIDVTLTAKNMRGKYTKVFNVQKKHIRVSASELVDLTTLKLKRDYSTKTEIERLLRAEKYGEIEWDGKSK